MRPRTRKYIIVADEHAATVETIKALLEAFKYEVVCAANGKEALELTHKRAPYAIVLDITRPGVDGLTLSKELRSSDRTADVLVIGYSGQREIENFGAAQTAGVDYYLSKPIEPEVLLACLVPDLYLNVLRNFVLIASDLDQVDTASIRNSRAKALSKRAGDAVASAMARFKD